MDQDVTWYEARPRPRRLCVRWRSRSPCPKGGRSPSPILGPCLLWSNDWMDQDVTWYGGRPWPKRQCFRCEPIYPQKKGHTHPTQFLAYVYSGQMAGWMKRPLGAEVDLGAGHIVLDGVSAPAKGALQPPIFGPCLLWPRSPISATAELLLKLATIRQMTAWIKMSLGMSLGLGPGDFVLYGDPAPPKKLAHVYCGQTA